jgi:hypothetical protein
MRAKSYVGQAVLVLEGGNRITPLPVYIGKELTYEVILSD